MYFGQRHRPKPEEPPPTIHPQVDHLPPPTWWLPGLVTTTNCQPPTREQGAVVVPQPDPPAAPPAPHSPPTVRRSERARKRITDSVVDGHRRARRIEATEPRLRDSSSRSLHLTEHDHYTARDQIS
ncbi:wiskott-Aldrich syndrome protein family member 2-like [Gouania willdenowi]|uniref:wiskott-Aldrich syndrome protein family member 2-like n=1 Tax=Gouania willdenowi TaxID=441366 RepID=UPI00105547CA|nr:wiskott-Aldrich syndrome protein family member 2-like [Gouania willdenowi]